MSSSYAREPEIIVPLAEVAEPLDVEDEDEDRDHVLGGIGLSPDDLRAQGGECGPQVAPGDVLDRVRHDLRELAELAVEPGIDGAAVEEVEPARLGATGRVLRGDAQDRHHHHRQRRLVVLADDQHVAAALRAEDDAGGVLDRDRVAQPGRIDLGGLRRPFGRLEQGIQERVLAHVRRQVPLEDDWRRLVDVPLVGHLLDPLQVLLATLVREPDDLEQVVPLHHAVGVVVDRLAGPGQQPGGRVVLAQDQVGVGLAALQGDAHGHLAERRPRQRIRAAQRLRAEDDVHAEGTTLANQPVQQQRDLLRDLVVLDEELLELVDDQQDARHGHVGLGLAIAGQVLAAQLPVDLAAFLQLDVQPLEHAQAELAFALDRDDPGVGQLHRGVHLELDAFLEVDQVQLELVGARSGAPRW